MTQLRAQATALLLAISIAACTIVVPSCIRRAPAPPPRTISEIVAAAPGLAGCTYTFLSTPVGSPDLHVIRCPLSSTTIGWKVRSGKRDETYALSVIDEHRSH